MFDDELDLAYAVINGVEARGERGNYGTRRVKFNSNSRVNFLLHTYEFSRPPTYS